MSRDTEGAVVYRIEGQKKDHGLPGNWRKTIGLGHFLAQCHSLFPTGGGARVSFGLVQVCFLTS
jgi:hypothetical protein